MIDLLCLWLPAVANEINLWVWKCYFQELRRYDSVTFAVARVGGCDETVTYIIHEGGGGSVRGNRSAVRLGIRLECIAGSFAQDGHPYCGAGCGLAVEDFPGFGVEDDCVGCVGEDDEVTACAGHCGDG